MKLGFDRFDITPELPVRLSGFGKYRLAEKVHDPLSARLFLFEKDNEETLIIQADLVAVDDYLVSLILDKTGISRNHLLVCATHTHSGPCGTLQTDQGPMAGLDSVVGELSPSYCEMIADKAAASLQKMRGQMQHFSYRILKGKVLGLGTDRHDPSLPCDEDALLIELIKEDQTKALMIRLACHATVLNQYNLEVSADFPGTLEKLFPEYEQVAFVNGCAGNMSTRFTRKGNGFDEVERYGKLIESQLRSLLESEIPYRNDFTLHIEQKKMILPVRKADTKEEAERKVKEAKAKVEKARSNHESPQNIRLLESLLEGAQNNLHSCRILNNLSKIELPVSWIKLPQINLIFVPVELFSELARPFKESLNAEFICYTNGCFNYMLDEASYKEEVYEAFTSYFDAQGANSFMKQISDWVKS